MSSSFQRCPFHWFAFLYAVGIVRCCESGLDDIALMLTIQLLQINNPLDHLVTRMLQHFRFTVSKQPIHEHFITLVSWIGALGRAWACFQVVCPRPDPASVRRVLPYTWRDCVMVRD